MKITVSADTAGIRKALRTLYADQMPYAMSLAINETAKQAQGKQRAGMYARFTVRRQSWVERSIKIGTFAKKTSLQADVRVETPGDPSRSDILTQHEDGGTKTPKGQHLAIPDDVRKSETQVIPRNKRPRAFNFKPAGGSSRVFIGDARTFMIKNPDGTGGIYQRTGRKGRIRKDGTRGKGAGRRLASDVESRSVRDLNIRTLYRFRPRATIDPRLEFEETVVGEVKLRINENVRAGFAKALGVARVG